MMLRQHTVASGSCARAGRTARRPVRVSATAAKTEPAHPPAADKSAASTPPPSADAQAPAGAASAAKKKGSWTPPYPSLVSNKPLPDKDVKTNIDM